MHAASIRNVPVALACLALLAISSPAATHYVVPPGTAGAAPADPYTNWATAGTNILEVVRAAQTNTAPRMVWITNGTYYLTNAIFLTNAITVQGVNGLSNTLINGNGPALSNYAFSISMPAGQTGIVDGLTITNCYASGLVLGNRSIVQNCLITDCRRGPGAVYGGGIYNLVNEYPITIRNCIVRHNYGSAGAGGIYMTYAASIVISDTLIEGNIDGGSVGGGGAIAYLSAATITNCIFRNNAGGVSGGGLKFQSNCGGSMVVDSTFLCNTANYANLYGAGGGIHSDGRSSPPLTITRCTIQRNVAAVENGGGIYALGKNNTIRNCLITDNVAATNGGGVWCQTGIVENCTIVSNHCVAASSAGGGLYMHADGGSVTGLNNIIYYNTASAAANFTNALGNTNLIYCCVFPAVEGGGNITNEPGLVNLAGGNYRLSAVASAINCGINQNWMTNACDLDGRRRIRYGIVDMGAYEAIYEGMLITFP